MAIIAGSSITPEEILDRVFLVAGATTTMSGTSNPGRSDDQPTLTWLPVAQPTARGVMIFVASSVIVTIMLAPCLLSSLASLTVSTAAIPPVTTRWTVFPASELPVILTAESRMPYPVHTSLSDHRHPKSG